MANSSTEAREYPAVGVLALMRLGLGFGWATVRRGDRTATFVRWARGEGEQRGSRNLTFNLGVRKLLLVGEPRLSAHILEQVPAEDGYVEGKVKQSAMAYLAPRALVISHGEGWHRRRAFNEHTLDTGHPHDLRADFLRATRSAFASPATSIEELRERMGAAMLGVVFGTTAPHDLVDDVEALIALVNNPVRRLALGLLYRRRRRRFYAELQRWRAYATDASLLGVSRGADGLGRDEAIEQVPHWMFTFVGSATLLLSRTLGMVGARPGVRQRVEQEIAGAGPLDDADTIGRLTYLEACIRESGRLFPPVARTSHVAPHGDVFEGRTVPAGVEVVHYFPLLQRDAALDPGADRFYPERWLGEHAAASPVTSNLFLSGPRECPGEDLILFVLKVALAELLVTHRLRVEAPTLAADPLPLKYPEDEVRFSLGAPARG